MGLSNAERQARWRARRAAEVEALRKAARATPEKPSKPAPEQPAAKAAPATDATREAEGERFKLLMEIDQLREQLAAARKAEPEQVAELRREVRHLQTERTRRDAAAKAAQTKAAKPPLDPDSAAARTIKGLHTRIKNLQTELGHTRHLLKLASVKHGHMDFKTEGLIAKALHPDGDTPSRKVREEAYKAFNAWKADSKAAGRGRSVT